MNNQHATKFVGLISKYFPSLNPWLEEEFRKAIFKDMTLYADEPNAMIGLCEYSASIQAFADVIAEVALEETIRLMCEMMNEELV